VFPPTHEATKDKKKSVTCANPKIPEVVPEVPKRLHCAGWLTFIPKSRLKQKPERCQDLRFAADADRFSVFLPGKIDTFSFALFLLAAPRSLGVVEPFA
jgi:hypothetical protein